MSVLHSEGEDIKKDLTCLALKDSHSYFDRHFPPPPLPLHQASGISDTCSRVGRHRRGKIPLVHDQGVRGWRWLFVSGHSAVHKGRSVRVSQTKPVQDITPFLSVSLPSLSYWTEPNKSVPSRITVLSVCASLRREKLKLSHRPGKSSGHFFFLLPFFYPSFLSSFFNINILPHRYSNDIRELTEFSTQLDMLIEKAVFKGRVHTDTDGGTIQRWQV